MDRVAIVGVGALVALLFPGAHLTAQTDERVVVATDVACRVSAETSSADCRIPEAQLPAVAAAALRLVADSAGRSRSPDVPIWIGGYRVPDDPPGARRIPTGALLRAIARDFPRVRSSAGRSPLRCPEEELSLLSDCWIPGGGWIVTFAFGRPEGRDPVRLEVGVNVTVSASECDAGCAGISGWTVELEQRADGAWLARSARLGFIS